MSNEFFELIPVQQELPPAGKYIVKTVSNSAMKSINYIYITISYNDKGEHTWACKNQKVTHWYKKI